MAAGYDSLPAFAAQLGCSRALIYQYVNGHVLVQPDRLTTIAELTGRSLEWFFAGDPSAAAGETEELRQRLRECRRESEELARSLARERGARSEQYEQHRRALTEALRELCLALRRTGDATAMLEVAPRWLELARDAGDESAAMDARLQMGHAWFHTGELARAERVLSDALVTAIALHDARAESSIRQEMVRALQAAGRTDEARHQAQRVADGERWWPRWSGLVSLAALAEQTGDLDGAEARLQEAAHAAEDGKASAQQRTLARAYVTSNRVNVSLARGRYGEALAQGESHRALAAAGNLPDQLREAALNTAIAQVRVGSVAEATEQLQRLDEWAMMSGDTRIGALARVFAGELARRCGDFAAAKQAALDAIERATESGHELVVGEAELALGEVYSAMGQWDDATHRLTKCVARASRLGLRRLEVAGRLGLARATVREQAEEAMEVLQGVRAAADEAGYEDLHADALVALAHRGPPDEARRLAGKATRVARSCGYFWGESGGLLAEARACAAAGQPAHAADRLRRAVRLKTERTGAAPGSAVLEEERQLQAALATACREAGEDDKAAQLEALGL
jgi:tetratricopeptide (TPR) repeat protein